MDKWMKHFFPACQKQLAALGRSRQRLVTCAGNNDQVTYRKHWARPQNTFVSFPFIGRRGAQTLRRRKRTTRQSPGQHCHLSAVAEIAEIRMKFSDSFQWNDLSRMNFSKENCSFIENFKRVAHHLRSGYLADFQVDEHADARKNVDFDSFVYFFLKLEINWFGGWVQLFSVRLFTWIRCIDLKINLEFFGYKNCLIGWRFTLKLQNCGSGIFSLTRPGAKVRHVKVTISLATGNTWTCRLTRSSIAHFQNEISFNDFSSAKHSLH